MGQGLADVFKILQYWMHTSACYYKNIYFVWGDPLLCPIGCFGKSIGRKPKIFISLCYNL